MIGTLFGDVSFRLLLYAVLTISLPTSINAVLDIKIGAILPKRDSSEFSIKNIKPAFDIALKAVQRRFDRLQNVKIEVLYEDSGCSIAQGPNAAIKLYTNEKVTAFFGPVCDYSLAPVARQAKFWSIPVITVGGMAGEFSREYMYPTLTRVGLINLSNLAQGLNRIHAHYKWRKAKILYESATDVKIRRLCHLAVSAIVYQDNQDGQLWFYRKFTKKDDLAEILKKEVGSDFSE